MTKIPKTPLGRRLCTKRGRSTCQRIIDIDLEGQPPLISGETICLEDSARKRGRIDGGVSLFPVWHAKLIRAVSHRDVHAKVTEYREQRNWNRQDL